MTGGDLPAAVLFGAVAAAVEPGMVWVLLLAVGSTLLLVLMLCCSWPDSADIDDDETVDQVPPPCECLACGAAYSPVDEDDCGCDQGADCDPLMDPIVDIFADEVRPLNEHRPPSVWSRLNSDSGNQAGRFDDLSRRSNERLVRWLTDEQRDRLVSAAAPDVVREAEAILKFDQSHRDRGETTGEIRRRLGDPGE